MKTLIARHKAGEHIGICSVCSAHPLVIEAALAFDRNSTTFANLFLRLPIKLGLHANALFSAAIIWGQTAGSKKMRMRRWKNPSSW